MKPAHTLLIARLCDCREQVEVGSPEQLSSTKQ